MNMLSKTKTMDRLFNAALMVFISLCVIICITPFMNIIAISLSSNDAIINEKVYLLPVGFNLDTYKNVIWDVSILRSFTFTVMLTVFYTAISMLMTISAAYPLTKKRLKGRNVFLLLIIATMYFYGGIIPDYLLISGMKLTNTIWSLILPSMVSVFNLLVLKSFFSTTIPVSLEESAKIDGCSDIGILIKIVLPLSLPVLATLSLFYAVWRWNVFQDARFYINDPKKFPLQLKLYQILFETMSTDSSMKEGAASQAAITPEGVKAACVMVATVPILLVYPWLQRYFVSGITVGAVKG